MSEEVLEKFGVSQVPLQFHLILQPLSDRIQVMKYSYMTRQYGISMQTLRNMMDSDLGACAYNAKTGQYIIYYNDTKSYPLCRFTIAHELGHIFLKHHQLSGSASLNRTFIPKDQYEEFEKEANAFARNLLSPAPLAYTIIKQNPGQEAKMLSVTFNISESAASVRMDFVREDLRTLSSDMVRFLNCLRIISRMPLCAGCGYQLPEGARYCPICGSRSRKVDYAFKSLPEPIPYDPAGSVTVCARCGNTYLSVGAKYCSICGAPATNYCTGGEQEGRPLHRHINPSYSRYCTDCGAKTMFLIYKVIQPEVSMIHYPVNYNDGVPYDEETMRVKICPRCHNQQFGSSAQFCRICGLDLYNRCDGMEEDQWGNWYPNENAMHANPSNARFCEICGRPTLFYTQKLLCDYTEFKPARLEEQVEYPGASDFFLPDEAEDESQDNVSTTVATSQNTSSYQPFALAAGDEELPF